MWEGMEKGPTVADDARSKRLARPFNATRHLQGGEPDTSMYAGGYVGSYGGVYNGYSPPAGLPSPPMSVPSPHSQVHGQVKKSTMMMDNRVPVMNSHPQNHNQSVSVYSTGR